MSTFANIENAVKGRRTSYKDIVAALCARDPSLAAQLLDECALKSADPKILRKKHRDAQVLKFKDDKDAIKVAMKEYDSSLPPECRPPKRVPPPPRKLTEDEKAHNKARNAYVKEEKKKLGEDVTISDMKLAIKKFRSDFDKKYKKKAVDEEVVDEDALDEEVVEDVADEEVVDDVVEEVVDDVVEEVVEDDEIEDDDNSVELNPEVVRKFAVQIKKGLREKDTKDEETQNAEAAKKAEKERRNAEALAAKKAEKYAKKMEEKMAKKLAEKAAKKAEKA